MLLKWLFISQAIFWLACDATTERKKGPSVPVINEKILTKQLTYDTSIKTIHVFVALCDNKYQGIIPVPDKIGNGQNPKTNLYWGCGYGVKTYFINSPEWKLVKSYKVSKTILERLVFRHSSKNYYLVADAYDGQYIKRCINQFILSCSGQARDTLNVGGKSIGIFGQSRLLAYVGHDGLMEFDLSGPFRPDGVKRDAIILSCASQTFFNKYIKAAGANPILWTTGLMCPEAYTLHDALAAYVNNETLSVIHTKAANAYNTYQRCGEKFAYDLFMTGW